MDQEAWAVVGHVDDPLAPAPPTSTAIFFPPPPPSSLKFPNLLSWCLCMANVRSHSITA